MSKVKKSYSQNVISMLIFRDAKKALDELQEKFGDIKITYFASKAIIDAVANEMLKRKAMEG